MILRAKDLDLSYGKKPIVKDVNMDIKRGEIVTMIGPNGSGKSTVIKALSRYLKPQRGQVLLENEDIFSLKTKQVARKVAVLPQMKNIPEDFSVETLVGYGRYPHLRFRQRFSKEDYEMIEWALKKTDLLKFKERHLNNLSGGEKQRAWIAMCLAQKPEILILDEPTTFLDISYQLELLDLIKELNESMGLTIIMVLHDINQAARYSNKLYAIKDGRIHSFGRPQDLLNEDFLKDVYKIKADVFQDNKHSCPYFIPLKRVK